MPRASRFSQKASERDAARKISTSSGAKLVPDRPAICSDPLRLHQQVAIRVVLRRQRIDAIDEVDQIGPARHLRLDAQLAQLTPVRVVVADRHGHPGQRGKITEQFVADVAVPERAFPVELGHQVAVRHRRGDAGIVQQAEIEQKRGLCARPALGLRAFGGHDADALTVRDIVDADQIKRIGERVDDVAEIGVQNQVVIVWAHGRNTPGNTGEGLSATNSF